MTITPQRLSQKLALRDQLRATLIEAMTHRDERWDIIDGEPGWVLYERETMHQAVNKARAEAGKQPLPVSAIEAMEQQAVGHSDYGSKYALYCAELALEHP